MNRYSCTQSGAEPQFDDNPCRRYSQPVQGCSSAGQCGYCTNCPPGPAGPQGPVGPTGATGAQGPIGETGPIGTAIVQTTTENSVLTVRNPDGTAEALTITPVAGGTRLVSAHLVITRIA